jgi:hypothetical protein
MEALQDWAQIKKMENQDRLVKMAPMEDLPTTALFCSKISK